MQVSEELKTKLEEAIESGKGTYWGHDEKEEFEYETFYTDVATAAVVKVLEEIDDLPDKFDDIEYREGFL